MKTVPVGAKPVTKVREPVAKVGEPVPAKFELVLLVLMELIENRSIQNFTTIFNGGMDGASIPETVDSGSILGRVKLKTYWRK